MPEVAGDAALLINPTSVEELRDALERVVSDDEVREQMIERGRVRRRMFSWDITAEKMWESMMKTVENRN
jgi:glycosyltransferase involved in cell wall biosynthesis